MRAMSPHLSSSFRSLLAVGALSAGVGCAENDVSVYIRANKAPVAASGVCSYTNDATSPSLFEGTLDLAFKSSYRLAPLIQSNLFAAVNPSSNRTETNHVFIEGFVVEVHDSSPDGPLITGNFSNPFTVYQTVTVAAGVGGQPATGIASFEALPAQIGQKLYQDVCVTNRGITAIPGNDSLCPVPRYNRQVTQRIILSVSAFGHTGGRVSIETPKFNYPVTVCCGCLTNFPPMMGTTVVDAGVGVIVTPSCNPGVPAGPATCPEITGQDFTVDCNICAAMNTSLCQPPGYTPFALNAMHPTVCRP